MVKSLTHLSIVLQLDQVSALIFQDEGLGLAVLHLQQQREVPVDVVVSQHVAARAGEREVAPVECEDMLAVDDHSADCWTKYVISIS